MDTDIPKWLDILGKVEKIPSTLLFSLALLTGSCVFASQEFLDNLGIDVFVNVYRTWFGISFLLCSIMLVTRTLSHIIGLMKHGSGSLFSQVTNAIDHKRKIELAKKFLTETNIEEKSLLALYWSIENRVHTIDHGLRLRIIAELLCTKYLLIKNYSGESFDEYSIPEEIWKLINEQPWHFATFEFLEEQAVRYQNFRKAAEIKKLGDKCRSDEAFMKAYRWPRLSTTVLANIARMRKSYESYLDQEFPPEKLEDIEDPV